MQIVYKLWEGSWEDGAVLRDRTQRVFARPEKVHRIRHDGKYFQIEALHLCEPSPRRTPLIYQAGASSRGRQFAATHAECVFINGPSKQVIAPIVADIRRRAAAAGRNPAQILIFTMMTVITAATSEAARAKLEDYRSYVSEEGALVLMPGWTGLDFSKYGPDEAILHSRQAGEQGNSRPDQGIPRSSAIWRFAVVTTPIVPTDLERCRESEQGRRQIFEVADADLGARGQLCPCESLLHARRRTRRRKRSAFRALHRAHPRRRAGVRIPLSPPAKGGPDSQTLPFARTTYFLRCCFYGTMTTRINFV